MVCGISMSGIGQKWRYAGMSFQETDAGVRVYVKKAPAGSSGKKKKRLPYSFKQLSQQIAKVKNSNGARPVITQVRQKLGWLYTKLRSGDYDDEEIAAAIVHATAMEKIAKRKMKHLEEEEHAENGGGGTSGEDEELYNEDTFAEEMALSDISEEMMEDLLEQFAEMMADEQESMMSEISEGVEAFSGEMTVDEIDVMKKKHRLDEERDLAKADMNYLKMMFEKYARDKKNAASTNSTFNSQNSDIGNFVDIVSPISDAGVCETPILDAAI